MSDYSRDGNVERQQIHEISLNVARRLLKLLETARLAPPALASEIDASTRIISDIQRDVENVMAMQPFGGPVDMAVLTHILSSQQHAIALLEQLEARTQAYAPAASPAAASPWPSHTPAPAPRPSSLSAYTPPNPGTSWTRTETPAPAPYAPPRPQHPSPGQQTYYATPASAAPYPSAPPAQPATQQFHDPRQAAARTQPPAQRAAPHQPQRAPSETRPPAGAQQVAAKAKFDVKAVTRRLSEPKYAAIAATGTVILGSLLLAYFLLPALPTKPTAENVAPGQKLDGRLETTSGENQTAAVDPTAQFSSAAHDPAATEQPYLVVLATRASTAELQKDFQHFNESYADLLADRKARVDRIQGQDQKTWHRLSLIPPQSQAEAKELCAKLRAAGLTGCWIRRVPLNAAR